MTLTVAVNSDPSAPRKLEVLKDAVCRHRETYMFSKRFVKAIPLQVSTGTEVSRNLRLPDFKTICT